MNITSTISGACGNGIDCDFVYDTDDPDDILVRGRFMTEPVFVDGKQVRLPAHEGMVRVKRSVYYGSSA